MKTNLLKGSFIYGSVSIISRVVAIILISVLSKSMSSIEYGLLNLTLSAVLIFNYVVTLEVAQGVTYFYTKKNILEKNVYPSTALQFSIIMYLVYILTFLLIGFFGFKIVYNHTIENFKLYFFGIIWLAANGLFLLIQNQLRLEFKSKAFAILTLAYLVTSSSGAIAGLFLSNFKAEGVLMGQGLSAILVVSISVLIFRKSFQIRFSKEKLKSMLKFSTPLVVAGLLLLGGQQIPKFILGAFGSLSDVGIFSLAYQIAGFAALSVLGVQTAITPSILSFQDNEDTPQRLANILEVFTFIALLFCLALSIFANEIVLIFSNSNYIGAAILVPYLSFSIVLNNFYIFFPGKFIKGKSKLQLIPSAVSFLLATLLGILFVKLFGSLGAAIATLVSSFAFLFVWGILSQKLYQLPINWKKLVSMTIITVIICSLTVFLIPIKISLLFISIKICILMLFIPLIGKKQIMQFVDKFIKPRLSAK